MPDTSAGAEMEKKSTEGGLKIHDKVAVCGLNAPGNQEYNGRVGHIKAWNVTIKFKFQAT